MRCLMVLLTFVTSLVGCFVQAAVEPPIAACDPVDVRKQTLELVGEGSCKVPPYATIAQFVCTRQAPEITIATSGDLCTTNVRFWCGRGPVWLFELHQVTDEELRGSVTVVGPDCAWHGEATAMVKR